MPGEDRVTLRDVYEAINRIEDKFDRRLSSVEEDVGNLQSFQNKALGILSVLTIFVSAASTYVWNKITNHT